MLQTEFVLNEISNKKLSGQVSLSTLEVKLKGSIDLPFLKHIIMRKNGHVFLL